MLAKRIKNIFKRRKKPTTASPVSYKSSGSLGNWPSGATADNSSTPHKCQFETSESFSRRSAVQEESSIVEEIALEKEEVGPYCISETTSETVSSRSHQREESIAEEIPVVIEEEEEPFVEEETKTAVQNGVDMASKRNTEEYAVERRICFGQLGPYLP